MTDWIRNIKHNPPPPNVMVDVLVNDYSGDCIIQAQRIDYKKPRKSWTWGWFDAKGIKLDEDVYAWRMP